MYRQGERETNLLGGKEGRKGLHSFKWSGRLVLFWKEGSGLLGRMWWAVGSIKPASQWWYSRLAGPGGSSSPPSAHVTLSQMKANKDQN